MEGYRIPDTSDGRGREFPTYQMGLPMGTHCPVLEGYRIPDTFDGRGAKFLTD